MPVTRYALTLSAANQLGPNAAAVIVRTKPGGTLTGSNIVELNIEDSAATKVAVINALQAALGRLQAENWPTA